jgi:hypothetical protein
MSIPKGMKVCGANGETYTGGQRGRKPLWVSNGDYNIMKACKIRGSSVKKEVARKACKKSIMNSDDYKKVISFLSSKDAKDLKGVSHDFMSIFNKLNSSERGKISETVFKLAIFLKIQIPEIPQFPLTLLERNQKCFKIRDIGFGAKSGGCDIMATSDNFILAGTAKVKHINSDKKTQWGEIEWQNVFVEAGLDGKYKDSKQVFLALVGDKGDLDNAIPSIIKERFLKKNRVVVDISDVSNLWGQVLSVFEKHGWDNQSVEEGVRDRMTLKLRPHQKECIEHALSRLSVMNKKEGYLIADKPRAGKTIMFAEIVRNLWEQKNSGV